MIMQIIDVENSNYALTGTSEEDDKDIYKAYLESLLITY